MRSRDYLNMLETPVPTVGKINLPSTIMQFFDLGGQRDIRSIWPKYYDECHAVVFVVDASDQARLSETWEVFGRCFQFLRFSSAASCNCLHPNHLSFIHRPLRSTKVVWLPTAD